MLIYSNGVRRGNMDTHHPCKEEASSRTNKDGKEYVKNHIPRQKNNIRIREKTNVSDVIEQARRRR